MHLAVQESKQDEFKILGFYMRVFAAIHNERKVPEYVLRVFIPTVRESTNSESGEHAIVMTPPPVKGNAFGVRLSSLTGKEIEILV